MIVSTDVVDISPELAARILKGNIGNRTVRKGVIDRYGKMMTDGDWKLTHQGILLDRRERLIDGQTRLMAIVKSGVTVRMLVSRDDGDLSPSGLPIDRGGNRSAGFSYGANPDGFSVARTLLWLAGDRSNESSVTDPETLAVYNAIDLQLSLLISTHRKGVTNATTRAATVLAMLEAPGNQLDIANQYSKLVHGDHDGMWPIVDLLEKKASDAALRHSTINRAENVFYAYKAMIAVGPARMVKKLLVKNLNEHLAIICTVAKKHTSLMIAKSRQGKL